EPISSFARHGVPQAVAKLEALAVFCELNVLGERQPFGIVSDHCVEVLIDVGFETCPVARGCGFAFALSFEHRCKKHCGRNDKRYSHTEGFYQRERESLVSGISSKVFFASLRLCAKCFFSPRRQDSRFRSTSAPVPRLLLPIPSGNPRLRRRRPC